LKRIVDTLVSVVYCHFVKRKRGSCSIRHQLSSAWSNWCPFTAKQLRKTSVQDELAVSEIYYCLAYLLPTIASFRICLVRS